MYNFENSLKSEGYKLICGVDEAGRGPLAGCVVASAVILPKDDIIEGLDDSKKLSQKKREFLFEEITKRAELFCIATSDHLEIDKHNILSATFIAMNRAVAGLKHSPDYVLVDGNANPEFGVSTKTIIGGDALSASIAAASILAKVYRDKLMVELDKQYPEYAFAQHKGYPTKLHYERILKYGYCPIHRMSFLRKLIKANPQLKMNSKYEKQ